MNIDEKYSVSGASGVKDDPDALLQEVTAKLGLETDDLGGGSSKPAAMKRYLLPKIMICAVVLLALAVLAVWLFSPAAFRDIETLDDGAGTVSMDFGVSKAELLDSVTADLDGAPVAVDMLAPDAYHVDIPANGTLTLTARTFAGKVTTEKMTISSVDDKPPTVVRDQARNNMMYIFFEDEGPAGIDWGSLVVTDAQTGSKLEDVKVNEAKAYIYFPFPDSPARISLADMRGNPLAVLLRPAVEETEEATPPQGL